ncbi:patatin-like phospholipase family protein [Burkholderia cepacia]|uniref:patatin-like phospholipase family protein n=1 Tax=Burkholderia cepacia TaxID=292 RepID=UPI0009BE4865|nr:patatin-like phospholipase family protein [Burkholderia cepacia]
MKNNVGNTSEVGWSSFVIRPYKSIIYIIVGLMFTACTPRIINNSENFVATKRLGEATTYTFANWAGKDHRPELAPDLIIVTLSGGGIRAAALAASTLNELGKFSINGRPLTSNIILISSTSGGSIAAGYIAAHGFDQYARFRKDFLEKNNNIRLLGSGLGPRLFYDRSAVLQDFLEKEFSLDGMTFDQLLSKDGAPFFVFNATDISGGRAFKFTQRDFDLICTDLGRLPISSGVTASSALPFVLTDIEFKNHWDKCGLHGYRKFSDGVFVWANDVAEARYKDQFIHAFDDGGNDVPGRRPQYLHLSDGGLADNLGARAISDLVDIDDFGTIADEINPKSNGPAIRQVLILEVNARSDAGQPKLDASSGSPGVVSMAGIVTGIPIDSTTSLSSFMSDVAWASSVSGRPYVNDGMIIKTQIDFDLIPDSEGSLRHDVKSIGMGLSLTSTQLDDLERASRTLLRSNPCFARFVSQSGATAPGYTLPAIGTTGFPFGCMKLTEYGAW